MFTRTLVAATLVAAGTSAQAATVLYDFENFFGNILGVTTSPAHVQASDVAVGSPRGGLCWNTDIGGTNDFACGGFGSSTLSFTVQAEAGWQLDINSFVFQGLGVNPALLARMGHGSRVILEDYDLGRITERLRDFVLEGVT